jgi:hypothetical protein
LSNGLDPRYSPAVLEEDRPTVYESLGMVLAPGLAAALALYESRGGFGGPRCRPCESCFSMSEADSPYCARCRVENERRAMEKAGDRWIHGGRKR